MKYINTIIHTIKDLDINIKRILKKGIILSFLLLLFSALLLSLYQSSGLFKLFYIGIILLKSSMHFMSAFLIGAISFNTIKNELHIH